jgi:tetratricopeptide (TPR) repeat protein
MVGLAPDDEWGHRICAYALRKIGRHEEATRAAAECVRLDPLSWQSHHTYAAVSLRVPRLVRDGHAAARRAVELAPNEPDAHFVLALTAETLRMDEIAVQAYERTLALNPNHPAALNNLTAMRGHFRIKRAAQGYAAALREDPGASYAKSNLDRLAFGFLRRLYWPALGALLIGLLLAGSGGSAAPVSATSLVLGFVVVAALTAYAVRLGRQIPAGARRYALARIRSEPFLVAAACLSAAMILTSALICFVPGGAEVAIASLRFLGLANVAVVVWASVWSSNRE